MNQKDELEQNQQTAQAEVTAAETPKAEEVRDQEQSRQEKKAVKKEKKQEQRLEKDLEESQKKLSELTDSHLRLKADFENYKKRNQVAVADAYNEGMAYALGEFLKVMDNMERALAAAKEAENEAIAGGIQLSMDSFLKAFEKHGFARIESDGAEFDPNLHNAVMQTPTEDDALRGKVAQTLQVGYLLHGKVLRHSMVAVYA